MTPFAEQISLQLVTMGLSPLNSEQIECLADRARLEEAAAMLDDLQARCWVRLPLPEGTEFGPFATEDEAQLEAEAQAKKYDAVALDEAATDDGRSFGKNEYYVVGFNGPEAALAAARRGWITYWVKGEQ